MIGKIGSIVNYIKYGKVVYKSPSGTTIRKKVTAPFLDKSYVETVKTVINSDGKAEKTLNRRIVRTDNELTTVFHENNINPETGIATRNPVKMYHKDKNSKAITDYTKPGYDYRIITLPNGKKQYEICFPEVTIIKNGVVDTFMPTQTVIK